METPDFVSVTTPSGTKKMPLAPFDNTSSKTNPKCRHNKRKADVISSDTWLKNLERRGGFWGDAYWYDLQLERRMPQAKSMLSELVFALPPCGGLKVLDLCVGSGRAAAAVLEAYPTVQLVLIDSSQERLTMAAQRLEAVQRGVKERTEFVTKVVKSETKFYDEPVDVVAACLAFHVLVKKPPHYGIQEEKKSVEETYEQLFRTTWRVLRPGGHVVFADHVGQMPLFKQLKLLEKAGFEDVDCAWRQEDSFVAGGRKPQATDMPTSVRNDRPPPSTKNYGLLVRRAGLSPGVASIVFVPAAVSVTVGGVGAFYSVVLRCSIAPEQAVTVSPINLPTGLRVLPSLHVFTQENWNEPQYFRVAAVNGGVFEELRGGAAVIEHTTSSLDPRFHGRRVVHLPSSVQAYVSPRDGYYLFATGKTAAVSSQESLPPKPKLPFTFHEFTEIELRRSALGARPLVARCSMLMPMPPGAIAAVAAVEASNQAAAQAALHQSRRRLSAASAVVKVMAASANLGATEEPATAARASLDQSNALVKLTGHGDKTLALYHDGEVLMLGSGEISSTNIQSSQDIGADAALSRMLLDVACGDKCVVGASEQGYLVAWGEEYKTRSQNIKSSSIDEEPARFPRVVQSLLHKRIVQVACGANHSFALAEDGDVFSWGVGRSGALGHGLNAHEQTFDTVSSPMEVLALKSRRVVYISCGDMHTAALLLDGELLTCGLRDHGRLGRQVARINAYGKVTIVSDAVDDGECSSWFAPVIFPHEGVRCTYVACGAAHTLAVCGPHDLYAFGWNSNGQLGVGDCRDRFVPTRVVYFDAVSQCRSSALPPLSIASVAAGKNHSLASSPDGRLFSWGNDEMGQCGLSSCPQIYTLPHLVTSMIGLRVTQLAAGEAHSAVLTSHTQQHLETLERTQPTQYAQLVEQYENYIKDDAKRRSQVLERARRQQLERGAAARRRNPPVDPGTETLVKILALQALVDQDAALDAKYARAPRPQTARCRFSSMTDEADKRKFDKDTQHQVRCSSASMVRQARLAVLQAPLATFVATPSIQKRVTSASSSKPICHRRPFSSSHQRRQRTTSEEGQRRLTATLLNQSSPHTTSAKVSTFPPSRPKSAPCRSAVRIVDASST